MAGTKKSLLASGVALLASVALLAGTTFAWFTDSVTNTGNTIQAGTLEIALNGGDETTLFSSGEGTDFWWEPGRSQKATANITNEGTLWLKYTMSFDNVVTTGDANITEVLDVYLVDADAADLTDAKPLGTMKELMAAGSFAAKNNVLAPKGYTGDDGRSSESFTVVVKMKEEADNDYQGAGVTFDIVIHAAQYTYEEDGFGNPNYDEDAEYPAWDGSVATDAELDAITDEQAKTVSVSKPEQLAALAQAVNAGNTYEGYTLELTDDINLNNKPWTPVGNSEAGAGFWEGNAFKGSIDGNGHTISNLYIEDTDRAANLGLFGMIVLSDDGFIRDVKFENAYVNGEKAANVGVLAGAVSGGTAWASGGYLPSRITGITVTDATVSGMKYVGGVIGYANTSLEDVTVSGVKATAKFDAAYMNPNEPVNDSGQNAGAVVGDLFDLRSIKGVTVSDCVITGLNKLGGVAGSARHAVKITNATVSGIELVALVEEAGEKSDNYFGWIAGRVGKRNEPQYTGNTVDTESCTATLDGEAIEVSSYVLV